MRDWNKNFHGLPLNLDNAQQLWLNASAKCTEVSVLVRGVADALIITAKSRDTNTINNTWQLWRNQDTTSEYIKEYYG
jgi:hypothetical protein